MEREQVFSFIYLITSNFSILPLTNFAHRNLPPETRNHRGLQREEEAIIFKESVAVLSPERRDLSTFRSKGEIGAPLPSFLPSSSTYSCSVIAVSLGGISILAHTVAQSQLSQPPPHSLSSFPPSVCAKCTFYSINCMKKSYPL